MNKLCCSIAIVVIWGSAGKADTLSYLRFEEGSGYGAYDETGLMDGGVLGFDSVDPGGGETRAITAGVQVFPRQRYH